jgi:saccharopepsin
MLHVTSFTVGTPPQRFDAIVDLASQDLIIPSGHPEAGRLPRHFYNSSISSTFKPNGTSSSSNFFGINTTGILSQDDLRLGDVLVPGQMFQETEKMGINGCLFCDLEFDTTLPLGPYNSSAEKNYMSPIAQLVENGILDENKFSLRLSRNAEDGDGQLLLGGVLDQSLYSGQFIDIPLTLLPIPQIPEINPIYISGDCWKVEVTTFAIGSTPNDTYTFPNPTIAILDISYPWIMLPSSLAKKINRIFEPDLWGPFGWVDCSKRSSWPNITFVVAGKTLELTPYDYTLEQHFGDEPGVLYCQLAFVGAFHDGREDGLILLGSAFVKTWVSVWNLDGSVVSCKFSDEVGNEFYTLTHLILTLIVARAKHGPPRECSEDERSSFDRCASMKGK